MENLLGYAASVLIGISLGLVGGGGSILTVPVLVYLFNVEPSLATAYSLFIVGITSLVGGVKGALDRVVDFRVAAVFSVPGLAAVYVTRRYILPVIPEELISLNGIVVTRDSAIMVFFAVIMVAAAMAMIRSGRVQRVSSSAGLPYLKIFLEGLVVGVLTGIVGAGGGFLIIPALVLFANLPMEKAVGTSLVIIAIKSLVGFLGDMGAGQQINFFLLGAISAMAVTGVFLGSYIARQLDSSSLKRGFGWFVLLIAIGVVTTEILR